jgi:hypothetical protein
MIIDDAMAQIAIEKPTAEKAEESARNLIDMHLKKGELSEALDLAMLCNLKDEQKRAAKALLIRPFIAQEQKKVHGHLVSGGFVFDFCDAVQKFEGLSKDFLKKKYLDKKDINDAFREAFELCALHDEGDLTRAYRREAIARKFLGKPELRIALEERIKAALAHGPIYYREAIQAAQELGDQKRVYEIALKWYRVTLPDYSSAESLKREFNLSKEDTDKALIDYAARRLRKGE